VTRKPPASVCCASTPCSGAAIEYETTSNIGSFAVPRETVLNEAGRGRFGTRSGVRARFDARRARDWQHPAEHGASVGLRRAGPATTCRLACHGLDARDTRSVIRPGWAKDLQRAFHTCVTGPCAEHSHLVHSTHNMGPFFVGRAAFRHSGEMSAPEQEPGGPASLGLAIQLVASSSDLDGTLIDSRVDIASAANPHSPGTASPSCRWTRSRATSETAHARSWPGQLGSTRRPSLLAPLLEAFLGYYAAHATDHTTAAARRARGARGTLSPAARAVHHKPRSTTEADARELTSPLNFL